MATKLKRKTSAVYDDLAKRAVEAGLSISDYLHREYEKAHPPRPIAEVLADIAKLPKIELDMSPADMIRESRGPLPQGD